MILLILLAEIWDFNAQKYNLFSQATLKQFLKCGVTLKVVKNPCIYKD